MGGFNVATVEDEEMVPAAEFENDLKAYSGEQARAVRNSYPGKTVHIIKHYGGTVVILGFFAWAIVMWAAGSGTGGLKTNYQLTNDFPREYPLNHDWVEQPGLFGKDHEARVAMFIWVIWFCPLGIWILSFLAHAALVWWGDADEEYGPRIFFEYQADEAQHVGFAPTFELGVGVLALSLLEATIPVQAGQRPIMALLGFLGLCVAVNFMGFLVEASTIFSIFSHREHVSGAIMRFVSMAGIPYIAYILLFTLQYVVLLFWVFEFNTSSDYSTPIMVNGLYTFIVKLVLIVIQGAYHGYLLSHRFRNERSIFRNVLTNPNYYQSLRGIGQLTILLVYTIVTYVYAHKHHCFPNWWFCHDPIV
ncbi:MAG: hypothetical protein JSS82_03555 [Bacteroidetes bacterium]|nr:hypothetical protein [Bacteroidota bacterium]